MATYIKTKNLSLQTMQNMIGELDAARTIQQGNEREATIASIFFTIIGVPIFFMATPVAMAAWAAGLINAGYAISLDNLEDLCTNAITELEYMKDFLQTNSNYDLIKVEVTVRSVVYSNKTYEIPIKFNVIAVHCTNPNGWVTL